MDRTLIALLAALALTGCHTQSSTQQINAEQADQLNAIAANQTEDAGNDIAQNAAQAGDIGQAYRAGAGAPPRKYR
jgi:outer membrane PBP1 activator LpoA protein